jgi:cholesterol transport system auxiliary component
MKRAVLIMVAAVALGGCVRFGAKPPAALLTLTSAQQIPADTQRTAASGDAITVAVPIVPQSLANTRVAVADGDTSLAYVKDAVWSEPPAKLFQRLLSETISARTGKVVLDPRQFSLDPGIKLTGSLASFGLDARKSEAVVVYDAAMSRDQGRQVVTRRFEARVPYGEILPGPAGTALNAAANKVAEQVAAWVG